MNKISSQSKITEVDASSNRIVGLFDKSELKTDSHLSSTINRLMHLNRMLNDAINSKQAESNLDEVDIVLDNRVRALFHLIKGFCYHPAKECSTPANNVNNVLQHYGLRIIKESYATQSSLIDSLLNDLKKEEVSSDLNNLSGCNELVNQIEIAQKDFKENYIIHHEQVANESSKESASEIKREVVKLINDNLIVYLNAMRQVKPEQYKSFVDTVEQVIDANNSNVQQRRKSSKKE